MENRLMDMMVDIPEANTVGIMVVIRASIMVFILSYH
jgi:hypothetical protein